MSGTWQSEDPYRWPRIGPLGWALVAIRGPVLVALQLAGLALHLALRLVEWPVAGRRRPVTRLVAPVVSRLSLALLGIRFAVEGRPDEGRGVAVANHVSWLDIFVLNAGQRVEFVSKSEVASWPLIGWMARATGTLFVDRDPRQARAQAGLLADRIRAGGQLLLFPEGTSTDGLRVLRFKSALLSGLGDIPGLTIQPVSVIYVAPPKADPRFYGWWGDMGFGEHVLQVLAAWPQGEARVVFHAPIPASGHADRKRLAQALEDRVRTGLVAALGDLVEQEPEESPV